MAQFPYLPLFTDAYIADTMHLDCMESGAYLHLLIAAWRSPDCDLPDDDKMLARMAKCTPRQWVKIRPAVMAFWTLEEHKWTQKRLLGERQYVTAKRDQQSQAGKASALKRKENSSTDVAPPLPTDGQQPIPTPTPTPKVKGKKSKKEYNIDFLAWYSNYPRQESKAKAEHIFLELVGSGVVTKQELNEGVLRYCEEIKRNGTETKYVKHPTTWLNGAHWEDDHTEIIHPGGNNKTGRGFAELAAETLADMERRQ